MGSTDLRALGPVAGVLGGLCWTVRWLVAGDGGWDALHWVGLVLLAVALGVVGVGLVSRGALWLRALVGVAFPLLVWALYWAVRGEGSSVTLDGVIGLLAVLIGVVVVVVTRRAAEPAVARSGNHAAR